MGNTMMKILPKVILAVFFFAMSAAVQAQLDLSGKVLYGIKEKARDPSLIKGIDAYENNDFLAASSAFEPLAAKGDAIAQFYLGRMHMQGLGSFKPDYNEALEFTRKAARQGLAEAEELLGFLYYYGLGVPQDQKQAAEWLRKAAEQGMSEAQNNLGVLYEKGQGVPQDWVQAYKWYGLAVNAGEEAAVVRMENVAVSMTPKQIMEAEALQTKAEEEARLRAQAKTKAKAYEEARMTKLRPVAEPVPVTPDITPVATSVPEKTVIAVSNSTIPAEHAVAKTSTASDSDEVLKIINEWAAAWSSKNVKLYLAFYAEDFKTPGGESRNAWEAQRHERISKPKSIHVNISNLKVEFIDDSHASVSFKQSYSASHLKSSSSKTLVLVKSGSSWLIQEERSGR